MLEKFTNSVKKVVGAGVIAAASLTAQDASAGLRRAEYQPLTTQSVEENIAFKDSLKSSLQNKFAAELKAKGLQGITLNFVELTMNGVSRVSVSGSLIESYVASDIMAESKVVNKEVAQFGVSVSKEVASNKYLLEEELSEVIKEAIDGTSVPVNDGYTGSPKYNDGYVGSPAQNNYGSGMTDMQSTETRETE